MIRGTVKRKTKYKPTIDMGNQIHVDVANSRYGLATNVVSKSIKNGNNFSKDRIICPLDLQK